MMSWFDGQNEVDMKREVWVDNVKIIACILVVLGHFFQSMTKALILPETDLYMWFNQTIYYFHVPLFFVFVIMPTFSCKKNAYVGFTVALLFKTVSIISRGFDVYVVSSAISNEKIRGVRHFLKNVEFTLLNTAY
jgi:hypothetical protein